MATINYGELGSITHKHFYPKMVDNIFGSNPLLARARKKWYHKVSGGTEFVMPLAYAVTSAAGWYNGGSDTQSVAANDQIDSAKFDWKYVYANIVISRADELKNGGPEQIIDFVKAKVQLAEKTLAYTLGEGLYNAGTTANQVVGLQLGIDSTGTYGGISRTTYSWWAGNEDSTSTVLTIPLMQGLYGDCTVGNDKPTVITTTQNVFDDYHNLLQPQMRYTDQSTADAGFSNLVFHNAPVIVDSHCPAGDMYMINEDYITLAVLADEDFRFEPFQKPTNQNMSVAHVYWAGALGINNCRMHGKFNAIA